MGVNSLQIGENSGLILLGKWSNGIDGGFANQARVLGADYFIVHPDVYDRLLHAFGKSQTEEIFWGMDRAAIQHGIDTKKAFSYTLIDTPADDLTRDRNILEQLAEIRYPTLSEAEGIIMSQYGINSYDKINFRMREILVAVENNRAVVKTSRDMFALVR